MKNVTVTVQIQFDVFSSDRDSIREEVNNVLSQMSATLDQQHGDRAPMIFTNSLDSSDIHISGMCQKYVDSEALPDEDGKCSLCGGDCVDEE
jgi:hypothetical protein